MAAKSQKFVKGRSLKAIGKSKVLRKAKTAPKTGVRKVRKQRDIKMTGPKGHQKRHVRTKSR